jgi:hypothetical protein
VSNESIRRAGVVALTVLFVPLLAATRLRAQPLGEEALRQIAAVLAEKRTRTPAESKLDTSLLFAYRQSRGEAMVSSLPPRSDPLLASANDYDLYLLNSSLSTIVDLSVNVQDGTQDPYEQLGPGAGVLGRRLVIARLRELRSPRCPRSTGPPARPAGTTASFP